MKNSLLLPKVDFLFKKIFGEEKNKELLRDFLASVLGLQKEKITGLTLTNNELPKNSHKDRKGTLDVRVEMDDDNEPGRKVELDVEIQLKPHESMSERILFYWSKMFIEPFESGMFFSRLRKTVSIIIFDENFLPLEK